MKTHDRINRIIAVARGEVESEWHGGDDEWLYGVAEMYREFQPHRAAFARRFLEQAEPLLADIPGVDLQVEPDFDTSDVELAKLAFHLEGVPADLQGFIEDFVCLLVHYPKPFDGRGL